jgi:hypothetical protein
MSAPVLTTPAPAAPLRDYQFWFRAAQHPAATRVGLSDALEVQFCR